MIIIFLKEKSDFSIEKSEYQRPLVCTIPYLTNNRQEFCHVTTLTQGLKTKWLPSNIPGLKNIH